MSISERGSHRFDQAPDTSDLDVIALRAAGPGSFPQLAGEEPGKTPAKTPKDAPHSQSEKQEELEEELEDTFPASDPPTVTQPGTTGWDVEKKTLGDEYASTARGDPAWGQVRKVIPGWVWVAAGIAAVPLLQAARSPRRGTPPRLH